MDVCVSMVMVQGLRGIHYHALLAPVTVYFHFGGVGVSLVLRSTRPSKIRL